MRKLIPSTLVFITMFCGTTYASGLEQIAQQALNEYSVAGTSIARLEQGKVVEHFALGQNAPGKPLTTNSVFQVGSISKPIASWAVMTLIRDGKVDLDAPVQDYLTRWQLPPSDYKAADVTVRRLLSHTAGLSLSGYPGFFENKPLPSLESSLSGQTNGAGAVYIAQRPGDTFSYSGGGYTLLQLMVEEVSGMPFAEYAAKEVLQPLGMNNSSYQPDASLQALRASAHGSFVNPAAHHHFRAEAAASLHSTSHDLMQFLIANMSQNPVLSQEWVSLMHTPVSDLESGVHMGLGFFLQDDGAIIGHGGANQGWRADIAFDKRSRSGLVVLTNSENGSYLIDTVKCFWDQNYGPRVLTDSCAEKQSSWASNRTLFTGLALALGLIALSTVVWQLRRLVQRRLRVGAPSSSLKRTGLIISLAGALLWLAFFYTPIGATIVSGVSDVMATINYMPLGFDKFSISILALLCTLIFVLLSSNLDEKQSNLDSTTENV